MLTTYVTNQEIRCRSQKESCVVLHVFLNPLDSKGNYGATSNNKKTLVHWPLMVGCYVWYSEEEPRRAAAPPSPLLAVQNVTAHPSTASVSITSVAI